MRFFVCMLVLCVFAQGVIAADTWPRLNATAADTSYAAPENTARLFKLGNLPDGEMTVTASGAFELGDVREVEVLADGDARISFRREGANTWWIAVTMGTATEVKVNYWSQY